MTYSKGLHTYNLTDKSGRPVVWNRFTQYKKGIFDKERSQKFIVYIYKLLDQKAGRNQWIIVGDGQDVVGENVNVQLIYQVSDILEKHYPSALWRGLGLDLPTFFVDIIVEVLKYMSPAIRETVSLITSSQLPDYLNMKDTPSYKMKNLITPKP